MNVTVDNSRLFAAMERKRQIPKQHGPAIVNKSVLQIAVGSGGGGGLVQLTKKATAERIRADMKKPGPNGVPMLTYLATIAIKRAGGRFQNAAIGSGPRAQRKALSDWRAQVREMSRKILAARLRSAGATVAGWLHAAIRLAARVPGSSIGKGKGGVKLFPSGEASESFANFAMPGHLQAGLFNTTDGAGIVCPNSVIQQAVNNETRNIEAYIERKMNAAIGDAMNGTNYAKSVA